MMKLKGSCHCQAVHFTVNSNTPYPFMRCFCSICRKTAGGGGFAINIMGESKTLKVKGKQNVHIYHAHMGKKGKKIKRSSGQRHFCKHCASCLWIYDPEWPEWIYPFASAIDTALPKAPKHTNLMLKYAASWCDLPHGRNELNFQIYPDESIEEWHKRLRLLKK